MTKTVLVVAAHPDDEALGCGGTIARHVSAGDEVYAFFMTNGVSARQTSSETDAELRNDAAEAARKVLGVKRYIYNDFPDNQLDTVSLLTLTQAVESVIREIQPTIVYTHHHGDLNIDHRRTHEAVMTACRPQPEFCVTEIYAFEVVSATEWNTPQVLPFTPNHFVDISTYLDIKMKSIAAYSEEMRDAPHSRSSDNLHALARYRGCSVGLNQAEAFMLIRRVC
ncbi:PIG-L deacetylase family protein [uncultured Idiomarina sp.]|uniref:PIG-L deacetylase family protein n=1 Tax=uncultured Idiomarina sp. TaxID=352961 RepID=UPI002599F139|nr:PIG-L deacetylase family protein [uncultured Idiomarina sp.]